MLLPTAAMPREAVPIAQRRASVKKADAFWAGLREMYVNTAVMMDLFPTADF